MQQYKKIYWTEHSKIKMRHYGLSKTKLLNLLYKPERKERGIVEGTMAAMKTNKIFSRGKFVVQRKKNPGEVWLMYQDVKDSRKIISAWRYPGVSSPGEDIPIPEDIQRALMNNEIV